MPAPNSCSQWRFAATRAVSGLLRSTSHLARPSRLRGKSSGNCGKTSGVSAVTSSPGFRKLPRMNMCVVRCSSAASSFMIGVLSGLYSSVSRRSMSSRCATSRLSSGCSDWKYSAIFFGLLGRALVGRRACDLANVRRHGRGIGRARIVGHQHAEVPQRLAVSDRQSAPAGRSRFAASHSHRLADWHPLRQLVAPVPVPAPADHSRSGRATSRAASASWNSIA